MTVSYIPKNGRCTDKKSGPHIYFFDYKKNPEICSVKVFTSVSFKFITFQQNME